MKLSAPPFVLKGRARAIAQMQQLPLHQALNQVAQAEGFASWSLLSAKFNAASGEPNSTAELYQSLAPGDLMLIGARPRQGKTREALGLAIQAMQAGQQAFFFSLEYNNQDVTQLFTKLGHQPSSFGSQFHFDNAEQISASYITQQLQGQPAGTLVVVDYLQKLDEQRSKPTLANQIAELRAFARASGVTLVFLAQVHHGYDESARSLPAIDDIRLPNPLELTLFDQAFFMHGKQRALQDLAAA